jgi:hypothetical protein
MVTLAAMKTTRRYALWLLVFALLVGLGLASLAVFRIPRSKPTREDFGKIKKGMKEEEVEAILRKDPPDPPPRSMFQPFGFDCWEKYYGESGRLAPWVADRVYVRVSFIHGSDGRWQVERVSLATTKRGWKERIRACLPW